MTENDFYSIIFSMGIVERRLRDKERRIKEILDASRSLFLSKGYINTTMLDIAEEAELSRRTVYLYFKSKEEITFQVMIEAFSTLLEAITDAVNRKDSGVDQLKAMKNAYIDFYKNDFDQFFFTLFFDLKLTRETLSDKDAKECIKIIKKIMAIFISIMEKGVADRTLSVKGNIETTALTAMTIVHSTMQKVASRRDIIDDIFHYEEINLLENMFQILFSSLT